MAMKEFPSNDNNTERQASYETSEEVLLSLIKAFSDFQKAVEDAKK